MTDADDDGKSPDAASPPISEEQAANLTALLDEVVSHAGSAGPALRKGFLGWMRVDKVSEVRAADFSKAIAKLEEKRKARP